MIERGEPTVVAFGQAVVDQAGSEVLPGVPRWRLAQLAELTARVESSGDVMASGDGGDSIGVAQFHISNIDRWRPPWVAAGGEWRNTLEGSAWAFSRYLEARMLEDGEEAWTALLVPGVGELATRAAWRIGRRSPLTVVQDGYPWASAHEEEHVRESTKLAVRDSAVRLLGAAGALELAAVGLERAGMSSAASTVSMTARAVAAATVFFGGAIAVASEVRS